MIKIRLFYHKILVKIANSIKSILRLIYKNFLLVAVGAEVLEEILDRVAWTFAILGVLVFSPEILGFLKLLGPRCCTLFVGRIIFILATFWGTPTLTWLFLATLMNELVDFTVLPVTLLNGGVCRFIDEGSNRIGPTGERLVREPKFNVIPPVESLFCD